jgi:hypothetical protein
VPADLIHRDNRKVAPLGHRRIAADSVKVVRKFDEAWHFGGAAYLEARVETSRGDEAKIVKVQFSRPWAARSPGANADSIRLYGSRLLGDGKWLASDDDEGRCWVSEDTGRANGGLIITAA